MNKQHKNALPGSAQEWLKHAVSDVAMARLGFASNAVLREQVCFHAQQAVEKALKGVLLHRQIRFPLTHDIQELIEIGEHENVAFPAWAEELPALTPFAVETRYPGNWEAVSHTEVTRALDSAQLTVDWAAAIIVPGKRE